MITYTIIIATYNRCKLLGETLESLLLYHKRRSFGDGVEIIVVNNNSTDQTDSIANYYSDKFDNFTVINECKQGLSHARNAAVEASKSDVLIFLDDDIELADDWFESLTLHFADKTVAVVGGKVLPFGLCALPNWLPKEYGYLVSVFDPSDRLMQIDKVMGANFAVRKSALINAGSFNPSLGRNGKKLLGGEEVAVFKKISATGLSIIFEPKSIVYHKINEKINIDYIKSYSYWLGVSEAKIDKESSYMKLALKRVRSYLFPLFVYPIASIFWDRNSASAKLTIKVQYARGYRNSFREN